jgi:hypothetical protein
MIAAKVEEMSLGGVLEPDFALVKAGARVEPSLTHFTRYAGKKNANTWLHSAASFLPGFFPSSTLGPSSALKEVHVCVAKVDWSFLLLTIFFY